MRDVEAALDALDLPDANHLEATTFVNSGCSNADYWNERRRLERQGFGPFDAMVRAGAFRRASSVRGKTPLTTTPTPTVSHPFTDTLSPVFSTAKTPTLSITQRALATLVRPVPVTSSVKPVKRQRLDEQTAADWFAAASSLPDVSVHAAHLRLTPAVEAKALAQPEAADWLRRRINRYLKAELGYVPPMVLALGIESRHGPSLHAHIVIALPDDLLPAADRALRLAGGASERGNFRKHQLVMKPARTAGAAVYAYQNSEQARRSGLVQGKTFVASNIIRSHRA